MKTYKIFATWEMSGWVEIDADSLDEAIEIAEAADSPLPIDPYYLEDSFKGDFLGVGWKGTHNCKPASTGKLNFELEVNLHPFHYETSRAFGVVFTENFIKRFLSDKPELIGRLSGHIFQTYDSYERDWLIDELADELIGMSYPLNMDSDEYSREFKTKWLAYISDSDDIDREKSEEYLDKHNA